MTIDPETTALIWQARGRIERQGITGAVENLRIGFGDMLSFKPLMPGGTDPRGMLDLKRYLDKNPDHPMAEPQNQIRIEAGDYLKSNAASILTTDATQRLQCLHDALFDRAAAVRLSVAQTLGLLCRSASIPVLEKLVLLEDESDWVRAAATDSLRKCQDASKDA